MRNLSVSECQATSGAILSTSDVLDWIRQLQGKPGDNGGQTGDHGVPSTPSYGNEMGRILGAAVVFSGVAALTAIVAGGLGFLQWWNRS